MPTLQEQLEDPLFIARKAKKLQGQSATAFGSVYQGPGATPWMSAAQGLTPDQAKMSGTPNAIKGYLYKEQLKAKQDAERPAIDPKWAQDANSFGQVAKLEADTPELMTKEAMKQATSLAAQVLIKQDHPDLLKPGVPQALSQIAGGDIANGVLALNAALGRTMTNPLSVEEVQAFFVGNTDAIKKALTDVLPQKATMSWVLSSQDELRKLGFGSAVDVSSYLDVPLDKLTQMSHGEFQKAMRAKQSMYADVDAWFQIAADTTLSAEDRLYAHQMLVRAGYIGQRNAQDKTNNLASQIEDGDKVTIMGQQYMIDELLADTGIMSMVNSALADPSYLNRLLGDPNTIKLGEWISTNMKALSAQADTRSKGTQDVQEQAKRESEMNKLPDDTLLDDYTMKLLLPGWGGPIGKLGTPRALLGILKDGGLNQEQRTNLLDNLMAAINEWKATGKSKYLEPLLNGDAALIARMKMAPGVAATERQEAQKAEDEKKAIEEAKKPPNCADGAAIQKKAQSVPGLRNAYEIWRELNAVFPDGKIPPDLTILGMSGKALTDFGWLITKIMTGEYSSPDAAGFATMWNDLLSKCKDLTPEKSLAAINQTKADLIAAQKRADEIAAANLKKVQDNKVVGDRKQLINGYVTSWSAKKSQQQGWINRLRKRVESGDLLRAAGQFLYDNALVCNWKNEFGSPWEGQKNKVYEAILADMTPEQQALWPEFQKKYVAYQRMTANVARLTQAVWEAKGAKHGALKWGERLQNALINCDFAAVEELLKGDRALQCSWSRKGDVFHNLVDSSGVGIDFGQIKGGKADTFLRQMNEYLALLKEPGKVTVDMYARPGSRTEE